MRSLLSSALIGLLGLLVSTSCVASGADVHLAPLYTRLSSAGGGTKSEALFGIALTERERHDGPVERWAVRPLGGWQREPDGPAGVTPGSNALSRVDFLYPLGRHTTGVRTTSSWFLPLYSFKSRPTGAGSRRWTLLTLPGFWFAGEPDGLSSVAWFPIAGHVEDFLTYDELNFFLFPLWSSAQRDGKASTHLLFPFIGWTFGGGESSHHFWPLYLHAEIDGVYERNTVLWPLIHWQTNLKFKGAEKAQRMWMVWPLFGATRQESYRSYSTLWPFFGWATDSRSDFWALDAPWPLVRVQRGGKNPEADERTRLWPFYSHFRGDRLESWNVIWPLVHKRQETYPHSHRSSFYALPFWQSWRKKDEATGEKSSWKKLWPLYQDRREVGRERFSALAPYPFHFDSEFDFYWAWMFELWVTEELPKLDHRSERAWGGLWRRERDAFEDRRSLTGLWSARKYREAGRVVEETSILFGLLRWRSIEGVDTEFLTPAFPGPGWPAERGSEQLCTPAKATLRESDS